MALSAPNQEDALSKRLEGIQISDLVRGLMMKLTGQPDGFGQGGCASDEIVLDTHIGGIRYLLIRMPIVAPSLSLSPREEEIVRMVAKGYSNKIIAEVLNISSWTVCTHLRRIFVKLGVGSRAAMVGRLLKEGWIRDHTYPNSGHKAQKRADSAPPVTKKGPVSDQRAPETWPNPIGGQLSSIRKEREACRAAECTEALTDSIANLSDTRFA